MMKRNILAVVIPALLVAGAANAAELYNKDGNKLSLYGKVDARHKFTSDKSDDGDHTYARFGFKGETQINSELTGYGQWEAEAKAKKPESDSGNFKTRLGFAGLKFADYGSLDYGRNYGVVYDVEAWTDVLPVFGGDTYTYTDNFMTGRTNGVATYRNNGFFGLVDGLNVALQYQGKNGTKGESNNGRADLSEQNGDGFGMSASYDLGWGVSAAAAYSTSNRTLSQKHGLAVGDIAEGNKAQAWTTGLKYDANNVYIAAMYAETLNMTPFGKSTSVDGGGIANKTQNFEAVAQYQFDFGLRPSIAYLQSKGKQLGLDSNLNKDLVKYVDLGASYYFNKNMSTYVDYKINLLDGNDDFYKANGITTDNVVGVGLIYQF
ncbi:Outer membrane protein C [Edwardsiella anguillarum]|uniref:porin OmpC n=1 Tax=Edwardsiella TaxID=635 RepID=UPI00045C9784|nr:porin OmpC [Edwardsiella anguillarum]GAJ66521.1 porin [Edwardsiella piscicida]BET80455.1 Outer membrane protein C [Edwardsiella anguillarum]BET83743.1 Outer membrane protein C [Edwardsiella anguillarum]BET87110.1 Outer membrane protein C [Edwardsiella anguillarum]BET90536.1 Outer membrane protein C [Edwardsiella anguillarum]